MEKEGLMFEYFVPIQSSAELDGDFTINGIAINETTTSNGHKFIGEELSKAANTLVGVPLLKDHDNSVDSIVGKVNGAHFDEGLRNIPFSAIVIDSKMKQLIKDGLLSTVSVGAHVNPEDIEETDDGDIIPHNIQFKELSLVAVGADSGATFGVALNNAYKSHSTKVENLKSIERGDDMKEQEEKTEEESTETPETEETKETVEEPKEEVSEEEKVVDEKIAKLRIKAKKKKLALMEADADEAPVEVKPVEEPKKEEPEEDEDEEEEVEEDEVEEMADYKFTSGHRSIGVERKSYVYN